MGKNILYYCPNCGKWQKTHIRKDYVWRFENENKAFFIQAPKRFCVVCRRSIEDPELEKNAYAVCRSRLGLLSSRQIEEIRLLSGLDKEQFWNAVAGGRPNGRADMIKHRFPLYLQSREEDGVLRAFGRLLDAMKKNEAWHAADSNAEAPLPLTELRADEEPFPGGDGDTDSALFLYGGMCVNGPLSLVVQIVQAAMEILRENRNKEGDAC